MFYKDRPKFDTPKCPGCTNENFFWFPCLCVPNFQPFQDGMQGIANHCTGQGSANH